MIGTTDLGYELHVSPDADRPGRARLEVTVRAKPTGAHFDPEKIRLTIATRPGDIHLLTVRHPWGKEPEPLRVCAGRIIVQDRVGKRVEFLTLGGALRIDTIGGFTRCDIDSPAPIMVLALEHHIPSELLAEEIECVLAHRRAEWETKPGEFDRRLSVAAPDALYMACLIALCEKFGCFPHDALNGTATHLTHFLREEIDRLQRSTASEIALARIEDIL